MVTISATEKIRYEDDIEFINAIESSEEESDEFMYSEVTGFHGSKKKLSLLNYKNLSSHEMDELFNDWT